MGTTRKSQRRYKEALEAFEEARERFTRLDEPGSVAVAWHQTGIVYQQAGQPEAAEDAYRKSLAIAVRLGDVAGQASTLLQLGTLYAAVVDRPEEAVAFLRQSADKCVEMHDVSHEGLVRSNLANTLRKLCRLDEARQEIRRVIECMERFGHASEPWKTWAILADIETDAGNPAAAAEAKGKAIACYLAYRRDGGESHRGPGRLVVDMTEKLRTDGRGAAASFLQQLANDPDLAELFPFLRTLEAIVAGSRDRTLADAPDLDYGMAAEILFLIETLENPRQRPRDRRSVAAQVCYRLTATQRGARFEVAASATVRASRWGAVKRRNANMNPHFLFIVCQRGAENVLKQEVAREHPALRFAYSRPGFVTFKLPDDEPPAEDAELRCVFARTHGLSLGKVEGDTAQRMAASLWELAGDLHFDHLHVWQRDAALPGDGGFEPGLTPLAEEVGQVIAGQMPAEPRAVCCR